jgi:hypothetical protein
MNGAVSEFYVLCICFTSVSHKCRLHVGFREDVIHFFAYRERAGLRSHLVSVLETRIAKIALRETKTRDVNWFLNLERIPKDILKYDESRFHIISLIMSRVRGSVTYNNGFWVGCLDLLALLLQLLLSTITRNHNNLNR